jgi:hypothetical protein
MRGAKASIWVASVAFVVVALIFMPGCSLFVPKQQAVTIRSSDPNADVYVDGEKVGKGTISMTLDRTKSHTVTAKADGRAGAAAINKKISGTGVLDIVGGCFFLIPFLGVLGAGFWELDPDAVTVYLQ